MDALSGQIAHTIYAMETTRKMLQDQLDTLLQQSPQPLQPALLILEIMRVENHLEKWYLAWRNRKED